MELIRPFARIGKDDAALAGGKGASLGEMTQAGIPVPPGYVILSAAFERFIEETDLNVEIDALLATVKTENMQTVEDASGKIQELILAAKMPEDIGKEVKEHFATLGAEFVAVRSSATAEDSASAAWAGQLDTYLNTTEETLLENVQRCWASLFTPRAIFYRFEKGLHATKISVAVVVQKMVNSDAAGIAFSVHPITEDRNQLIIEAGFGLGEAVVSGQVTPDSYVVTKEPREIIDKNISEQTRGIYRKAGGGNEWKDIPNEKANSQVLSDAQILALAETVCGIERHYGFPVDIEWAMENSVIYITQSRPITTLTPPVNENFNSAPSADPAGGAGSLFVENIPSAIRDEISKRTWFRYGIYRDEIFPISTWIGSLARANRSYNDFTRSIRNLVKTGDPAFLDENEMREQEEFFAQKLKDDGNAYLAAYKEHHTEVCVELLKVSEEMKALDVKALSNEALRTEFSRLLAAAAETGPYLWNLTFINTVIAAHVHEALESVKPDWSEKQRADFIESISYPKDKLAFQREKETVLRSDLNNEKVLGSLYEEFKWLSMGPFSGRPFTYEAYAARVQGMKADAHLAKNVTGLDEGIDEANRAVASIEDARVRELLELVRSLIHLKAYRIDVYALSLSNTLELFDEVAQRLSLPFEKLLKLTGEEIVHALEMGKAPADFDKRETYLYVLLDGVLHHFYGKARGEVEKLLYKEDYSKLTELHGVTAYKGIVRGTAKVLMTDLDLHKLEKGDILVANLTNPNYDPAFGMVAGVVTDEGGLLCHSAIMSREFKIPCIIGTKVATLAIQDGDQLEVDADAGIVRILSRPSVVKPSILSRIFSRERSLFYFMLWYDSDQEGVKRFLDVKLASGLFIRNPDGRQSEVWYPSAEVERVTAIALEKLNGDAALRARAIAFLEENWAKLKPYLDGAIKIDNAAELWTYYQQLIDFWNVMNTVMFELAGSPDASPEFSKEVLRIRSVTEHYTEKMDRLFSERFEALYPTLARFSGFVAPQEVARIEANPEDAAFLAVLEDRKAHGCFVYDGHIRPMRELEATLAANGLEFEKHDTQGLSEAKGITAQVGKVTGRACVLLGRADMDKVEEGDIIVSPMTTPDFLPAMKKAAGFVTDEGSLTCHAAIVAREMKKPCIVGTKIATHLFKDGDMIEVDATSGVARIIK